MAWSDTVQLMRSDVEGLGDDAQHSWRLTLRLYASINTLTFKLASSLGVSTRELAALLAIWDGGRCTMTELGHRIDLSRAAITTMADRLESAGLVQRVPDPNDRRRLFVIITELCDSKLEAAFAPLTAELDSLASGEDWRTFASVAAGVRAAAHRVADDVDVEPRTERSKRKPAKRGPKPQPTHW
jgi:DNA-binding MarR family transcriptional regulator